MPKEDNRKKSRDKLSGPRKAAGSPGLAVSEFIDSAGVNSRETGVGEAPPLAETRKTRMGRAVEKALANPTLVVVGLAAIPLLFLAWGFIRRKGREGEKERGREGETI